MQRERASGTTAFRNWLEGTGRDVGGGRVLSSVCLDSCDRAVRVRNLNREPCRKWVKS